VTDAGHWLESLELHTLARAAGQRNFELALESTVGYASPPELEDDALVATFDDDARVELRCSFDRKHLFGRCSQCTSTFGPCVHGTMLAMDLSGPTPLREALLHGGDVREAAAEAPELRQSLHRERTFERSLRGWLAPAAGAVAVEIAASPFEEPKRTEGRPYGERTSSNLGPTLSIFVRLAGERKLLSPRELSSLAHFRSGDRRVLRYAHDNLFGRKSWQARGVDAALTIEAMREHGGIFATGYKGLLDFRRQTVRPRIEIGPDQTTIEASWVVEDTILGTARILASESVFFAGPFPYLWTRSGVIYRVAADVDLELAEELVRAPTLPIPPGKMKDAGARLFRAVRGRGVELSAPEAFGLTPIETPRFVLRLSGEPLSLEGQLVAVYRAGELSLFAGDVLREGEDGRDREGETQAAVRHSWIHVAEQLESVLETVTLRGNRVIAA